MMKNPIMTMVLNNDQKIIIELYPQYAPNTVNSIIDLAKRQLLNHRKIQRIAYDFVLQITYDAFNHDPECEYLIEGEFTNNHHYNPIAFTKGIVGMGGDGQRLSAGCDFFIVISEHVQHRLNDKFTAFGKVIEGYEYIEQIIKVPTRKIILDDTPDVDINEPLDDIIIKEVNVETYGIDYPKPVKLTLE